MPSDNYNNNTDDLHNETSPIQQIDASNVDLFQRIDYSVTTE